MEHSPSPPSRPDGPLRVLLIEDDPEDARRFEESLQQSDISFDLRRETSLTDGLDALDADVPDVLVVDPDLPDGSGIGPVKQCMAATRHTPIVVLTDRETIKVSIEALDAGATDYLPKEALFPALTVRTLRGAIRQKRMELEIRQRTEWIESITENAPNGIYRSTPEDGIVYANEAFVSLFGAERPEALHAMDPPALYADPDERARLSQIEREQGAISRVEVEFQRLDGSTFTGLLSSRVVRDDDGTVAYYDGTVVDITERKQRERELREARKEVKTQRDVLRRSQKVSQVGGWEYDPQTDTVRGTEELYRILGLPGEDFTLKTWIDLYAPEARPNVEAAVDACIADGTPFDLEVPLLRPDGEQRQVRVRGAAQQENGETVRVTGVLQDITSRKAKERKLRMLSEAVEQARETVLITEAAPLDEPGPRIVYVNAAFEAKTGYAEEEVLGQSPRFLQGPETDRAVLDRFRAALEAGEEWSGETVNYRKDGTPYVVQWNVAPVRSDDGTIEYWVSVQRDVTDEREMEAALRERKKYLSVTLDSIGDAVVATDPEGQVTEMNAVAEQLTGWSRSDAEGQMLSDILSLHSAKTGAPVESPVDQVLRHGKIVGLANHTMLTARDGTEYQIADSAAPIRTDEGTLLGVVLVFRDVTEQYERRRTLEIERQRFEMALTGGDLGLWDWNMNTDAVVYNERWAEMLGYDLEEVEATEQFFAEHTHPDDLKRVREAIERHARGETPHIDLEIRMQAKDGSRRWILDRGKIVERNDDGSPRRMVGTHLDITDKKEREDELRRHRDLLELTQKLAGAWEVDLESEAVTWSEEVYRIHEVDPGTEITVEKAIDFYAPEARPQIREAFEHCIEEHEPYDLELPIITAEGNRRWARTVGSPVETKGDEVVKVAGAFQDITDRKQAEEALRRSREHLARAQRIAQLGSWERDLQTGDLYWSDETYCIFGVDADRPTEHEALVETMVHPDDRDPVRDEQKQAVTEGDPIDIEYRICRPDGEERVVYERGEVTVDDAGTPIRLSGTVLDVTERKEMEAQLRQAQKMETVGQLAGGVAHDFNNILHAAVAYIEMVRDGLPEDDADRVLLERAAQGLGRAGDLVQKLLTFSRQESAEPSEPVDVGAIVREALSLTQPSLPKSVALRTEIEEDQMTAAPPGELHQVVTNLLSNAMYATNEADAAEPVLDVEVRAIDVDADLARRHLGLEPGPYVRLSVSDTGPGMDAETEERIFEPFFTTKEVGEGTGLGLSVVHGIVTSCGGEIAVYSELGKGTTFDVYLPQVRGADALGGAREPAKVEAPREDARVLFVDDDPHITEMEAVRLRRIGCEVQTCESAEEALHVFDRSPEAFDAVITDFAMPREDGLALSETLRARGYEGPVILMSGFSAQVTAEEMEAAGVTTYVRKPIGKAELQRTLHHALRGAGGSAAGPTAEP